MNEKEVLSAENAEAVAHNLLRTASGIGAAITDLNLLAKCGSATIRANEEAFEKAVLDGENVMVVLRQLAMALDRAALLKIPM